MGLVVKCVCFLVTASVAHAIHANRNESCTLQTGVEFLGNDIAAPTVVTGEAVCCTACAANPACVFWTFEGRSGMCHLKNTNAPDSSRDNATCVSGYLGVSPPAPPAPNDVDVQLGGQRSTTGDAFVCWNIDGSANREFFVRNLSAADPASYGAQLARQAAALGRWQKAGHSLLRFGGTGNDYLTYAFGGTACPPPTDTTQCLNETHWRSLLSFAAAANARVIFGLSMNTGDDSNGGTGPFPYPWDPTNARQILSWTIDAKLDHLIFGATYNILLPCHMLLPYYIQHANSLLRPDIRNVCCMRHAVCCMLQGSSSATSRTRSTRARKSQKISQSCTTSRASCGLTCRHGRCCWGLTRTHSTARPACRCSAACATWHTTCNVAYNMQYGTSLDLFACLQTCRWGTLSLGYSNGTLMYSNALQVT